MNELSTKVKKEKLNIMQKIRLAIFKMQRFDIDKYANAPEYIKKDDELISKIINGPYRNEEKNLLLIPSEKLMELFDSNSIYISYFSEEKQIEFIKQKKELIKGIYPLEKIYSLLDREINSGNHNFISVINGEHYLRTYLEHLKENDNLSETLPRILKHMDNSIIESILNKKVELVASLTEEQQRAYAIKHPEAIKYVDSKIQWDFIEENPENIKIASDEVQTEFVIQDKNNLSKTSDEFQLKTIASHPNSYDYASDSIKTMVFEDLENPNCIKAIKSLLKKDIRNSKHIDSYEIVSRGGNRKKLYDLFENINTEDLETIKSMFFDSKLISAKGKLIDSNVILHSMLGEPAPYGIDDYISEQINIIQTLNTNQIQELVKIDSNYILPYLTGKGHNTEILPQEEMENSKRRCKELFRSMFGVGKLKSFENCIDLIYSKQLLEQQEIRRAGYEKDYDEKISKADKIPLNHFKLLFNSNIISMNSIEEINEYFDKVQKGEDTSDIFRKIMENAYGKETKKILESRPELNVHTINSLESFDRRIIDNFEVGFVHDLSSYNIRDFSGFLSVIKDENRLENFKVYYKVLSQIMGGNVETMQRAISEFIYNEELLQNVREVDLTDEQYQNLISVLCSKNNKYNINTLEELDNYNEIANKQTQEKLNKAYLLKEKFGSEPIKRCICEEFLGLDYSGGYLNRNYGDNFLYLRNLYDLQGETSKAEMYSEGELEILNFMNFLEKEENPEKLMELSKDLLSQKNIRNPVELYSAISKMKEHQLEIFNESLLTPNKMEELCKLHENEENPPIKKEIIEGVPKYTLQGIPFNILLHDTYGVKIEDFISYEGQLGNNAICSRNANEKTINTGKFGEWGFTNIEIEGGMISNSSGDANTNHIAKLVRGTGEIDKKVNEKQTTRGTETAFYRRYRKHDRITNENRGGKRVPDVYVQYTNCNEYDEKDLKFLKDNNIPIVYIERKAYEKLNNQEQERHNDEEREK